MLARLDQLEELVALCLALQYLFFHALRTHHVLVELLFVNLLVGGIRITYINYYSG